MSKPLQADEVTILIPAYQSAAFIDRTLLFARGQTHASLRIVVSVDAGDDNTGELVQAHAAQDARIVLHEQKARLGWVGNVNFLLGQVTTPYFFIYFHDDIILPQYTQWMLDHLQKYPDAAGVYCDMGHFGASDKISRGPNYTGPTTGRLLKLMLAPERGSPLRALLRSTKAGHIRLPDMGSGGFWANEALLLDMLAAGELEQLSQVLYLRWSQRSGGLTDGWKQLLPADISRGWRANVAVRLQSIENAGVTTAERKVLEYALFLQVFPAVKHLADEHGRHLFPTPADLHPRFADLEAGANFAQFGHDIANWAAERAAQCEA